MCFSSVIPSLTLGRPAQNKASARRFDAERSLQKLQPIGGHLRVKERGQLVKGHQGAR
jgi:hypothetical protein